MSTEARSSDWILTYTGKRFYPIEPRMQDVDIVDIGHALSNLCRYAGHPPHHYSVAQHSIHVAEDIANLGHPRDAQLAGLLHDAPEAYVVDVPAPVKKYLPDYRKIEDRLWQVIQAKFGIPDGIYDDIIKVSDQRVFAAEARDMMGDPEDWKSRKGLVPVEFKIIPWSNVVAKERFMVKFAEFV